MIFTDIVPALPEIFMALSTLLLLLLAVLSNRIAIHANTLAAAVITGALFLVCCGMTNAPAILFNGLFVADALAHFAKILLLFGALGSVVMGMPYARQHTPAFEYPVVLLLATLGTLLMVSANDMLALYAGLELQSLALYILASFRRNDTRSAEAGLKYFILGSLASGILLFGISLIYGATGATGFDALAAILKSVPAFSPLLLTGFVFVLAGLAFKISAAPFHMWVPDVYEGAPTHVTAFFAAVPKVAAFVLLLRVLFTPFEALSLSWQPIMVVLAIISMAVGAFAALRQSNIKRMMAYSSIGHVGYALLGVAAGTQAGLQAVLLYLAIYFAMTLGVFAIILSIRNDGRSIETIPEMAGLGKKHPLLAFLLALLMFSTAGVPPLAGFFGKFYVFTAAMNAGFVLLALFGVLMSAVSAYYYLRIIKVTYFDEPVIVIDIDQELTIRAVLCIIMLYIIGFALAPGFVLQSSGKAALSLLG